MLSWLLLLSYLQARGITRLAEGALGGSVPSRVKLAGAHAPTPRQRTADAIIARNPFDSAAPPLGRVPAPPVRLVNADPLSAPPCASAQVIIVTEARNPAWSVAALQVDAAARPRDYRVGDDVAGNTVEFIGYNPMQETPSVWLSNANGLCQTSLFAPAQKPQRVPARALPPVAAVDAPQTAWLSHVRVVPERKDGNIIGVRLFGVRPNSLLQLIGLQNGDRLDAINGFALGTPAQALSAYAQLRAARRVALDIERRGQPVTLAYRIN